MSRRADDPPRTRRERRSERGRTPPRPGRAAADGPGPGGAGGGGPAPAGDAGASERSAEAEGRPWQLRLFDLSLKKKQKLALLLDMAGPLDGRRCLLLTCGDNNGALNHRFRSAGGQWWWADMEEEGIPEMAAFLGEEVRHARPDALPFPDGRFDLVVVIDVHEHLEAVGPLNREIARVLAPGGQALVTTPSGDEDLPVARLKRWIGMDPAAYGHVVQGYRAGELEAMLRAVDLRPTARGAYSRFFTELVELAINFAYVKVMRRGSGGGREGVIAPDSESEVESVGGSLRLYALAYPLLRGVSALDAAVPGEGGYAVAVSARKAD